MREIDDAAKREDQRKAERDQQVIRADQKSVQNLLEDKNRLHAKDSALKESKSSGYVRQLPRMTWVKGSPDLAGTVLWRRNSLHVFVRAWYSAKRVIDIPLILHFARIFRPHRVHFHEHLIVI